MYRPGISWVSDGSYITLMRIKPCYTTLRRIRVGFPNKSAVGCTHGSRDSVLHQLSSIGLQIEINRIFYEPGGIRLPPATNLIRFKLLT